MGYRAGYNETGSNRLYINNDSSSSPLIWGNFNTDRVVINGNGTNGHQNNEFFVNGDAGGNTAWNTYSDERLKKNISTITNALEKVEKLRGINYEWRDDKKYANGLQIGFIAQEVKDVIPEVIDDSGEFYTMQYAPITALLVEAVKEQNVEFRSQNDELRDRISKLEEKNQELVKLNSEFRNQNLELLKDVDQIKNALNQIIVTKNEIKMTAK